MQHPLNKTVVVIQIEYWKMIEIENLIRQHALRRLASVFKVNVESLSLNARFGIDLKASFVSDFKFNEFDIIYNDIEDVSDKFMLKAFSNGELEIKTVADYCTHMIRCYAVKPQYVANLLSLPKIT